MKALVPLLAALLVWPVVHDETFLSPVYFLNNIFYNTGTAPTTWYRRTGALRQAVFSNNDYYESGGTHSAQEPVDPRGLRADPRFVGDPSTTSPGRASTRSGRRPRTSPCGRTRR